MALALSSTNKPGERFPPNAVSLDAAKQVEEYIKVSKETSSVAYELACIAQDLGSLWTNKYNDEKSVAADQLIEQIVGDRIPYTFGKRASDTIPSGLQALGQFLSEDPRHYGVRLSALYTGGNFIQERGERNKEVEVKASDILDTYDSSEDSSSDFESGKSSSEQSVNTVGSEEIENFDAQKWHREVDALLAEIQSKKEWETMAALREMYIFKDSERAADIVHVEALAELNDEELRGFDKTREDLDTQVEAKQLDMLQTLSAFNKSLKTTTGDLIRRRQARKKAAAKKRFSFSKMDEVVLVEKNEKDSEEEEEEAKARQAAEEAQRNKGNKAGELLQQISLLQKGMNDLVHDTHQKKLALEVHNEAKIHLTLAMEAAEGGADAVEPKEEVRDLLKAFQEEAKDLLDAEKKAAADARLKEVAEQKGPPDVSEESLKQQTPEELKVMLLRAEGDIQLLQTKMEELQSARITQAKGGADRIQKAKKAVQLQQQHAEKPAKGGDPSPSAKSVRNAVDPDSSRKKKVQEPTVMPPHQLMAKLEGQLPAAQKALEELQIHHDKFMESVEKANELHERLFLEPHMLDRRVSQPEVHPGKNAVAKAEPKAAAAKARPNEPRQKPQEVQDAPKASRKEASKPEDPEARERREEFQRLDEQLEKFKENLRTLSEHLSKVMGTDVGIETLDADIIAALLEDKESEKRQKQEHLIQLREELAELRHHSVEAVPAVEAVIPSASPKRNEASEGTAAPVTKRNTVVVAPRQRRNSQVDALEDLQKDVDPELMQQLLAAQGETLNIQEQLNSIEDLIKVVRSKGQNLSSQEKEQLKELFGGPDPKKDQSAEATELREEKKKIRALEKQVGEKRDAWNSIDGAAKALRGLAEGNMTQGEIAKKVRIVKAAYVRTGGIEDTGSGSTELGTLQAAAAMARTAERRRNSDATVHVGLDRLGAEPAVSSRRGRRASEGALSPASATSGRSGSTAIARSSSAVRSTSGGPGDRAPSVEIDELQDVPPVAAAPVAAAAPAAPTPGQSDPPGNTRRQRRRSSGALLAGGIVDGVGQVSLQVAVNMRRRHSLAAGLRASQEQIRRGPPLKIAGHGSEAAPSGEGMLGALNLSSRRASV